MDETRSKLVDAAGFEFAEKGFDGATVRSICERAGVNLAAVNYHFGDKERLYEAVVMSAHRSRPSWTDASQGAGADPRARLRWFVNAFLEETAAPHQSPWQQAVMLREIAAPTKASETLIRESFRPRFELLLAIVRELAPGLSARQVHAVGFSVIGQCLHYKLNRTVSERVVGVEALEALDLAFLVDHITRFTLAAVGCGAPLVGPTARDVGQSLTPSSEG